jgi:hypothetical protein
VPAGGANEVKVDPEGGEAVAPPDLVHGVEERGLGAGDGEVSGLRAGGGNKKAESYDETNENLFQHELPPSTGGVAFAPFSTSGGKGVERRREGNSSFGCLPRIPTAS